MIQTPGPVAIIYYHAMYCIHFFFVLTIGNIQENRQVVSGPQGLQLGVHGRQFAEQQPHHTEVAQDARRKFVVLRQHDK